MTVLVGVALTVVVVTAVRFVPERRESAAYGESDPVSAPSQEGVRTTPRTLPGIAAIPDDFERNALLYEFIAGADRDRVEQYLHGVADLPAAPHRADVVRVLYARYAALDPAAAADHVLGTARSTSWVATVFRAWARVDLDAALVRAEALDPNLRAVLAGAILELDLTVEERNEVAWRLDAAGQLAARYLAEGKSYEDQWERAIETERGRRARIEALARAWGKAEPKAALTAVISLHDSGLHTDVVGDVLVDWLKRQPGEAGAWLASQPPSQWSHTLTTDSLTRLLEEDASAALAAASALPDIDFDDVVRGGFGKVLEQDFDAAATWLATEGGSSDAGLVHTYAHHYARREPRGAFDWALYGDGHEGTRARRVWEVFRGIARTDVALARALADEVADPALRLEAAEVVVESGRGDEWNAEDSLRLMRSFRSVSHRARMASAVFSRWSRNYDLSYVVGWGRVYLDDEAYANAGVAANAALALPSGIVRDAALASVIGTVVSRDDALAERLFEELGSTPYRAWSAARLYTHFADKADSGRYRSILEAECQL